MSLDKPVTLALLLVAFLLVLVHPGLSWRCDVSSSVCEVWLEVDYHLTMMDYKTLVVAKDGLLYPYNNVSAENVIPVEKVITGDGWAEPRVVTGLNGSVPGPLLEFHEGQIVRVHVHNKMRSEATSIHFHGQHQRDTPWMDGVAFVTQCPIMPGQSFTHQFEAYPVGTHWYHAHTGPQFANGVMGAFIVHPKEGVSQEYADQFTLMLQAYNHDWDATMGFLKMEYGMYANGVKEDNSENLAGGQYSLFRCQSVLINNRGRYYDPQTGNHNGAPLETFTVKQGSTYRFRLVYAGSVFPVSVSVDQHKLRVVASDGKDLLEPVWADSVILTPGERYDFELAANHSTVQNYWIRVQTLEVGKNHTSEAILHYEGASVGQDPVSSPDPCTNASRCVVVNCPFLYYPQEDFTTCVNVERLRSVDPMPEDVGRGAKNIKEYFLNFGFPGLTSFPSSVNGNAMQPPRVSALTQPHSVDNRCPGDGYRCEEDEQCRCAGVLDLEHGQVIQLVMSNLGNGKGWDHPVHMHGHYFWVLKVGYPPFNETTGKMLGDNEDIDCKGRTDRDHESFCNRAEWANGNWSGNDVPGLNFDHPMEKDTVNVPTGGYVIVRFKTDNPGLWAMHCHVNLHLEDGMMLLLNESFSRHPHAPPEFRQCGNFRVDYEGIHPPPPPARESSRASPMFADKLSSVCLLLACFLLGVIVHDGTRQ